MRDQGHHHLEALGGDAVGEVGALVGEVVDAGEVQALHPALVAQRANQLHQVGAVDVHGALPTHDHHGRTVERLDLGRGHGVGGHRRIGGGAGVGHG